MWPLDTKGSQAASIPAGALGEILSASVAVGSAVSLTTSTPANVTSLALTQGTWDVSGVVAYHGGSGTVPEWVAQGLNTTSATLGAVGSYALDYLAVVIPTDPGCVTPVVRIVVPAGGVTIYLVAESSFTVSTLAAYGFVRAARVG